MALALAKISIFLPVFKISSARHENRTKITEVFLKCAKFLLVCITINYNMSAIFLEAEQSPAPLAICPRCGRQVRIDGHCECEAIFFAGYRRK
jgi:hypothetical protein